MLLKFEVLLSVLGKFIIHSTKPISQSTHRNNYPSISNFNFIQSTLFILISFYLYDPFICTPLVLLDVSRSSYSYYIFLFSGSKDCVVLNVNKYNELNQFFFLFYSLYKHTTERRRRRPRPKRPTDDDSALKKIAYIAELTNFYILHPEFIHTQKS